MDCCGKNRGDFYFDVDFAPLRAMGIMPTLRAAGPNGLGRLTIPALLAASVLAGCSDEVVYRDREPFNSPPAAAKGFLGYYDEGTKKTTCGNCHVDYESRWSGTHHARAYNTLNSNPGKQDNCFSCHTVNGKGNVASGTVAGHDAVKNATYFDVQCESCHGPGLEHVEGVGQATLVRPLAKLAATGNGTCADCHSGAHHPFAAEWAASRHATVNASRATNASCAGCHESRQALVKWGVDANYQEKAATATALPAATCATCHDPHGTSNTAQLRYPVTSQDPEQNLCMRCHMRRAEPEPPATASPHAPQGAVLLGAAGWRPPGFAYDTARIYGSHATEKNPRLCAGCHVTKFAVNDKITGQFVFQATGHLMRPVPCLDAQGVPTADKNCAYTTTARSWQSCTQSGCHANAAAASAAFTTVRARMKFLTDQLWQNLNNDGNLQAAPTDAGLLATLRAQRPNEWSAADNAITAAEGAEFNARLCGEYGQSNSDNSKGVHNPFLCESLLISTISYIRTFYGLPAATAADEARLRLSFGGAPRRAIRVAGGHSEE
jgi:predicted CXXCH cytochrome family protein